MTSLQKAIKYLAIAFAIFLSVSIISGICGAVFSLPYFFCGSDAVGEMKEYHIEDNIDILKIDLSAVDFEIKPGDELMFETNHKYINYDDKGNLLEINETKKLFAVTSNGVKLTLYVPRDKVFEYVYINTGAGRISIDTLLTDTLDLDLGAGEMLAQRMEAATKADIDGGAGAITISNGYFNNLDLDMGVGELNLTGKLTGDCDLDYGVGETNLHLIGDENDYIIELDKGIGEAFLDGRKMNDDSVYGGGKNRIKIDGGIGSINVDFKDEEGLIAGLMS